jgi:hypothetical protein
MQIALLRSMAPSETWQVEFEHAIVYGSVQDAFLMARNKEGWGNFLGITPLPSGFPIHPQRITYALKPSNRRYIRYHNRRRSRRILGADRRWVGLAHRFTQKRFFELLPEGAREVIALRLAVTPEQFWRSVKTGERNWQPLIGSLFPEAE